MKLEFEEFKNWLGSHLDSEVVGRSDTYYLNPLCNFLKHQEKISCYVGKEFFGYSLQSSKAFLLPDWAKVFKDKIDCLQAREVTAIDAYKILCEINPFPSEYIRVAQ